MLLFDVDFDQRGDRRRCRRGYAPDGGGELIVAAATAAEQQAERGVILCYPAEVALEPISVSDLPSEAVAVALAMVVNSRLPTSSRSAR